MGNVKRKFCMEQVLDDPVPGRLETFQRGCQFSLRGEPDQSRSVIKRALIAEAGRPALEPRSNCRIWASESTLSIKSTKLETLKVD